MRYQVKNKQPNSKMCFVCGLKNPKGLHASFYELDNGELLATFKPGDGYQAYPGSMHGCISAGILDETIGRAIRIKLGDDIWGVTAKFTVRYRKPIPLTGQIRVIGRITKDSGRIFEGTGEIILPDGSIAAEGYGKYVKLPLEEIAEFDFEEQEWKVTPSADDPTEVEL